jgi:cytidylate kinase
MARTIEQLVEQQVLRWLDAQRQFAAKSEPPLSQRQLPTICISREFGAGAGRIGRQIAEHLGFHYYSRELVDEIAKRAQVRRKAVESLDERVQGRFARLVSLVVPLRELSAEDYVQSLSTVVLALGRLGQSILVGRGAHLILDPRLTLRVRFEAPFDQRVERVGRYFKEGDAQARSRVSAVDEARVGFFRKHFHADVRDRSQFDLILDTGETAANDCAGIVVGAFESRFGARAVNSAS